MSESGGRGAVSGTRSTEQNEMDLLLKLMQKHMEASETRERDMQAMLQTALNRQSGAPTSSSSNPSAPPRPRPIGHAEVPRLIASAAMADFGAWRESWADYSKCQHLQDQDKDTCVAALRQCLDDDLSNDLFVKVSSRFRPQLTSLRLSTLCTSICGVSATRCWIEYNSINVTRRTVKVLTISTPACASCIMLAILSRTRCAEPAIPPVVLPVSTWQLRWRMTPSGTELSSASWRTRPGISYLRCQS